ncbi:hypothetical protein ACFL6F_00955 [Planctomycetota bacterium]
MSIKALISTQLLLAALLTALFSVPSSGAEPLKIKTVTVPERTIPEPEERGKRYPVPATKWKKDPVLWGWTCELPNGFGLAFGGVDQLSDDGRPHTRLKAGSSWKPIIEELRRKNPLQKRCEQVCELRNACKDALAKARHIYFEGTTPALEAKMIKAEVQPGVEKLIKDLGKLGRELKSKGSSGKYESGQVTFALKHLAIAAQEIKPFGARITPEQMVHMRRAQIELEIAAEAFDAEPPPRALSLIAYDPKSKLFVIFGGEHMDYVTNDLWVFDPAKLRWFQRHPSSAPEPRGDHLFEAVGDGRIAMQGGYFYKPGKGYIHVGPSRWIYDINKNAWSADGHAEKTFPADTRSEMYLPPSGPEHYMKGERPDAAANETKLKGLPVNVWVRLNTPVHLGGRDWATWVFDTDRDMLYVWAGGHGSYPGNDVARYHLATDRWETSDPIEIPLGCCGTNEQYPSGFNFNKRPWVKKHVWNSQAYDPGLRKMVMAGVNDSKLDPYFYLYDPDKADWVSRHRIAAGMGNDAYGMQVRYTSHGTLAWYGGGVWLLDSRNLIWKKIGTKGKMPGTGVDSCGLVYDSKRDRMLFATLGGYGKPYDGQIHALDMKTSQVKPLNPEGMDTSKTWRMFLREAAYDSKNDMFLWPQQLNRGGKMVPGMFTIYDPAKNRWVLAKIGTKGGRHITPFARWNNWVCYSIAYDAKRGLFWLGDSSSSGGVWVLRFDPAKTEIKPMKE